MRFFLPQPQKLCLEVHPGMCEDYTPLILAKFSKSEFFFAHCKPRNCLTLNLSRYHQDNLSQLKMLTRTNNMLNNIPMRL